ncbi:MAG TPA: AprI/Inh family metalloprotease inhibitor [Caulobacteraceae bacterium]
MRLALLFAVTALGSASAFAADAPPPDRAAAPLPVCTTVTTVVKRGDVVLSSNSTTKCEDAAHPGGGINLHPGSMLAGPEAVLAAPAAVFGSLSLGQGDELRLKNTAGDWRVIYDRTGDICHLTLSARTNQTGFLARSQGCKGALGRTGAWIFRDGATEILRADGGLIVRLVGTRDQITGSTADGEAVTLQR